MVVLHAMRLMLRRILYIETCRDLLQSTSLMKVMQDF